MEDPQLVSMVSRQAHAQHNSPNILRSSQQLAHHIGIVQNDLETDLDLPVRSLEVEADQPASYLPASLEQFDDVLESVPWAAGLPAACRCRFRLLRLVPRS